MDAYRSTVWCHVYSIVGYPEMPVRRCPAFYENTNQIPQNSLCKCAKLINQKKKAQVPTFNSAAASVYNCTLE